VTAVNLFFDITRPVLEVQDDSRYFGIRRIYCVGRNYVSHIREMQEGDERDQPFFFQKPTDAIVKNGTTISYPPATNDFQHEVELVVAIGEHGRNLTIENALDHVFGYAIGIDMTRRDQQFDARDRRRPWELGKSFDQSAPCGKLRKAREGHINSGKIALYVNDKQRQASDLKLMIWNVPEIISNISTLYDLMPGDIIYTGTPAGVSAVNPGDRLLAKIDGLADLTITIGDYNNPVI
jgi:fumarylpyruvate hydrolase